MAEHLRLLRAAETAEPDGALVFMASTPGVKRDGIDTAGMPWRVDAYRANPVVTWVHDFGGQRLPIGRAEVDVLNTGEGEFIRAAITFDRADPFAAEVERKYRDGFLHAVSVSWDDVDAGGVPVRSAGGRAVAHELLEIAAVPVPGDPAALIEGRRRSLAGLARDLLTALEVDATEDGAADGNVVGARGRDDCTDDCTDAGACACEGDAGDAADDAADAGEAGAEDEDAGDAVAAEMVAVFDPASDDSDATRSRRYRALLPAYRRLGWTAPELLPVAELRALDADVWRGLFVSGELDRTERAGKEISAANLAGLKDALAQLEAGCESLRAMVTRVDSGEERAATDPAPEDIARAIIESFSARVDRAD